LEQFEFLNGNGNYSGGRIQEITDKIIKSGGDGSRDFPKSEENINYVLTKIHNCNLTLNRDINKIRFLIEKIKRNI
jgi:hypothetical protein